MHRGILALATLARILLCAEPMAYFRPSRRHSLTLVTAAAMLAACTPDGASMQAGDSASQDEDAIRVCADGDTVDGVDVAVFDGHIDWAKVKASGKAFAFARGSYGALHDDTEFNANWTGIKAAGLYRGAYQYYRPSQDPIQQADHFVDQIGLPEPGDLPPVLDLEETEGVSVTTIVHGARAWLDEVKAKTGVDPIVYTGPGFWNSLTNTAQFAAEDLWVANYTKLCPSMPKTWNRWTFWQSSSSGSVPGIGTNVDLDHFNGSLSELDAYVKSLHPSVMASGCSSDADCNQGALGAGVICINTQCVSGCHTDGDCPSGETCDGGTGTCSVVQPPGCPVLAFPSGIRLLTFTDPDTTASYQNHLAAGQSAPTCFIDTDNLVDPVANQTYSLSVHLSQNFQLSEIVSTEISGGYGHHVLVNPDAVESLQKFRDAVGVPVSVNSGFRSPKHQEATCISICGNPLGCAGTCANNSRHMWGDAFDLPMTFSSTKDTNLACAAGFKFTYLESHTHLHVDQNPAYAQCVQQ